MHHHVSRPTTRWSRRVRLAVAALLAAASLSASPSVPQPQRLELTTLSNRADVVSGDDVLVEASLPAGTELSKVRFDLNGQDVTPAFAHRDDGRVLGLVAGLRLGQNSLTARGPSGTSSLTITNHPIGGPVFSGPQIQPWYCREGAIDDQCNRPTQFAYYYRSSQSNEFKPYDPDNPPDDVATTTTDQGETVPYIVRVETGTMDRGEYRIAVLEQPQDQWTRWTGPPAWNHKVFVLHGAGCDAGHSESTAPSVLNDGGLRRGFAVVSTALINNTDNCNLVVQAESLMMAKEHLVETYGDVRYLFGNGSSGGSMAQLHMANAYPGLYDGLTVGATFPDVPVTDVLDCEGLQRYFSDPGRWAPGVVWTEPAQAAAAGKAASSVCLTWSMPTGPTAFAEVFNPRNNQFGARFQCDVPGTEPDKMYDPETNPGGVRCAWQDYLVNIFGQRPPELWGPVEQEIGRGFGNRPYDNVGVQYGLRALRNGDITTDQFVDLNAKVGAVDIDFGTRPERAEADPAAIAAAYRSGAINVANNLDRVPIIDLPGFVPGDRYEVHDIYKSWSLRARLDAANGHHDNHIIWYGPEQRFQDSFGLMDAWLTAIEQDTRDVPREQKVVDNRPETAQDRCDVPDRASCDLLFGPGAGSTRWGAGDGIASDVLKCQLKPLVRSDYAPIMFTDSQWAQLQQAFPTGVCDWSEPGVGQQPTVPWQTYAEGPGGEPLGPGPSSTQPAGSAR